MKGYEITFTTETDAFVPAVVPTDEHRTKEDEDNRAFEAPDTGFEQLNDKRQKNSSEKAPNSNASSDGLTPMQMALAPFPKSLDAK